MGVKIKGKAYKKIESFVRTTMKDGEVGGLLLGHRKQNGDVIVRNAILMEQIKTGSTFEISEDAMFEFTKNANPNLLASVIGWWHSHCNFGTFWSIVDDDCFKRLANLSGFCYGIVGSIPTQTGQFEMKHRLDIIDKNNDIVSIDDIQPEIETGFKWNKSVKEIKRQISQYVKEDTRVWETCPTCKGQGVLEEKEYQDFGEETKTIEDKTEAKQIVDYHWTESDEQKYMGLGG